MFTYKKNRYKLSASLLDIVGVTPTGMTFSVAFSYLEGELDALPGVIVTDKDLSLMNAVKIVFPDATNLLCQFHIDKNVKANLVDCPCESSFDEYLKNFEMTCSLWPMFLDYVCQTWVILHKEKFVKAWTNKVMHLGNTTINSFDLNENIAIVYTLLVESAYWSLKRLLQNSLGDICSIWEAMNNMMTLQHTQIKASFETSTHMVEHVFNVTLYKKLLGMVSRYALNEIVAEYERFMQTKTLHFDVCGKVHLKTKLQEIAYLDLNSTCPPSEKVKTKGAPKKPLTKQQKSTKRDPSYWEYVDALHSVQNSNSLDFIENIIDVKADGNCGYRAIAALLGMGEESWSLVRNHLHKELTSWSEEYINLLSGIERFEELKHSLLIDGLSMVTIDKWMNIIDMRYVIASRYNIIIVSLSRKQSMTFFLLRSQSPPDSYVHCLICIGHVYVNHFVHAKQWPTPYIGRMQCYTNLSRLKTKFFDLGEE
ncbi:hypothetical protein HKD37_14G040929 [Glycine soja]